MSKIETDNFLMSSFSKEYKEVEDQICKEMNLNESNCCTEDLHSFDLNEMTEQYVEDPVFLEEVRHLLNSSGLDALFVEREKEAMEKKKGGKVNYFKPLRAIDRPNLFLNRSLIGTLNYSNQCQYKLFLMLTRCLEYGVYSKVNRSIMVFP